MNVSSVRKPVDVLTQSAPERVWLQVDTDGDPDDRREAIPRENWTDLTWHFSPIGGQEVVYVRVDLVAELIAADREFDAAQARRIEADNRITSGDRSDDAFRRQATARHAYDRAAGRRAAAISRIEVKS